MSGESPILETEHADAAQAMTSPSQAEKPAKRDACTMRDLTPFLLTKSTTDLNFSHRASITQEQATETREPYPLKNKYQEQVWRA